MGWLSPDRESGPLMQNTDMVVPGHGNPTSCVTLMPAWKCKLANYQANSQVRA